MLMLTAEVDDCFVLLRQRSGAVADEDHQIGIFHSLPGTRHTHGFNFVIGLPDTGSVNQPQTGLADHNGFFHGVAGGTGYFCDDDTVITCKCIEQAGLTHIRLAHNGSSYAGTQNTALTIGIQQGLECFHIGFQHTFVACKTEIFDVLVGIIQYRMEMAAQVGQIVIDGNQFFLQLAAHLTGGIGSSFRRVRLDQVNHCFCLRQIKVAIQKCPLGKFTTPCRLCAGMVQRFQTCGQNGRGAVAMKFDRVFTGVAVGPSGVNGAAGVDDAAFFVVQLAQNQFSIGRVA